MNLMKTYIYNLMKCFFIALFIFTVFRGERVLGYDKLFVGESEENIKADKIEEGFNLKGDLQVPVPSVGEAIVDYEIDRDAEFFLKDSYEGVSISEEGHLVVTSQAEAGKVNVVVAMAEGKELYFEIELSERLTKNLKGVTNKSLASPSFHEVVNEDSFINNFLLNKKVLFIFRCIITLILLSAGGVYLSWRRHFHKLTKDKLED